MLANLFELATGQPQRLASQIDFIVVDSYHAMKMEPVRIRGFLGRDDKRHGPIQDLQSTCDTAPEPIHGLAGGLSFRLYIGFEI